MSKFEKLSGKAKNIEQEIIANSSTSKKVENNKENQKNKSNLKDEEAVKKMNFNISLELFEKLKKLKFLYNISYTDYILAALKEKLEREHREL